MTTLILLLAACAAAYSQNPPVFPTRTATQNDLMVAANNGSTTLSIGINATATSLSVASGTGFIAPGVVTIDKEIMAICRVAGNALTVGHSSCPNVDGRGWDGSTAVNHNANRPVQERLTAGLHNQSAAEIQAIPNQLSDLIGGYANFSAACADATTKNLTLAVSRVWTNVASTACPPVSFVRGAMVKPASGAVVQFARITFQGGDYQVFDESVGGSGSILLKNSYVRPVWFGASCSGSTHDDGPGFNGGVAAISATGGTVDARGGGGQCWFNSIAVQVNAVNISGSNLTFDGNGATINSTLTGNFVVFGGNARGRQWQDPSRTKYSFVQTSIGDTSFTVCAGCGVKFKKGDAIYTQSGQVINGTPFNAEGNVVNSVSGDVLTLRYPIEHQFAYSAAPDGVSIVTADTLFNNTFRNWRTARQFQGIFMVAVQCIHCSYFDIDGDFSGGAFLVDGMDRDLLFDHVNISLTNPNPDYSPLFQFASGMSDTTIRRSNFACNGNTNNPASVVLNPSEGASNSIFEEGTVSGNCPIGSSTYQGFTLKDSLITLDTGPTNYEVVFAGAGNENSSRLKITGNKFVFPQTANKTNVIFTSDHALFQGNRILSSAVTGAGAVVATAKCAACVIEDNFIQTSGYGIVTAGLANHSFSIIGNNIACQVSNYSGILIHDDGQQTLGETVMSNTANGCATGLQLENPAHEIGSFTPNTFSGSTTPYSPASVAAPFTNP